MRWVAGFLLVVAAVLKAVELFTEPAAALVNPHGRSFLPVEIGIEFGIGLLVLSGFYWCTLRWFALLLFTTFAGYSIYLALTGAASCGCFGALHVNPWWTFTLDSLIVLGLLTSASVARRSVDKKRESSEAWLFMRFPPYRHAVAILMGVAVITTVLLFRYQRQRTVLAKGLLTSVGDLVILEPQKWIGQKLPIAQSLDIDLSKGEWVVLLHRHDCPVCQKAIPQYEQFALAGTTVALIEVPPFGDPAHRESACHYGRLKDGDEWFVQTPVEIRLQDGIVTEVRTRDH
jgi:hypothetical protein